MDISSPLLSVGDLNRAIAESLTERFDAVLVSGEISNFKAQLAPQPGFANQAWRGRRDIDS